MAKLRHVAIAVSNPEETAKFYEQAFDMKRVRGSISGAVLLSDGVVSLAFLDNRKSPEALGHHGLHHVGFVSDNVDETAKRAEKNGAAYVDSEESMARRFANRGQMKDGKVIAAAQQQDQRKYVDPNGSKFDIVNPEHARNSWLIPA